VLDIPPLGMTALTWGLFMGVSSNLRYQAVFGAERVVDRTIARRIPQVHAYTPVRVPVTWICRMTTEARLEEYM
jgi:Protein RETICULATA-related